MVIGTTSAKGQKHSERTKTQHKQMHVVLLLVNIEYNTINVDINKYKINPIFKLTEYFIITKIV